MLVINNRDKMTYFFFIKVNSNQKGIFYIKKNKYTYIKLFV